MVLSHSTTTPLLIFFSKMFSWSPLLTEYGENEPIACVTVVHGDVVVEDCMLTKQGVVVCRKGTV